jgi:two-component system, response regulator YesN
MAMKIAIVEDELRIREGLARLIRKIDSSYEIVGEAEDGLAGVRIIARLRPELVITDVRMPDLDGLEMLSRLEEKSIKVKAIVLSAYSDFSYARQAIKLGVSEYLLKPINVGDLTRALKRVEQQIALEQGPRRKEEGLTLEGVLYSLILGGSRVDEDLRSFLTRRWGVKTEGCFALAAIHVGSSYDSEAKGLLKRAQSILAKAPGFEHRLLELEDARMLVVIAFNVDNEGALRDWFAGSFLPRLKEARPKGICVGWASCGDIARLRDTMQELDACLDWNIVLGGECLLVWPDVNRKSAVPLAYPIAIESAVRSAFCAHDRERYETAIGEFMRSLHGDKVYAPKEIKSAFVRFVWSVLNVAREIEYESYASLDQQKILERITFAVTWPELEEAANILLRLFPRDEGEAQVDGSIVRRAKNLVRELYSQGISLNEVALKVSVTSEYLSAQFHRTTGVTFSSYVRDYRVQKAKELLIGTNLKLHSVGEQVGYEDAKYFCRVFKETTGLNPSEYRKANR